MAKSESFVKPGSVVREIWGNSDTILFIFAGASAEFALNKAVDWLYFTGRLPADPLNRLFSTVTYARLIVFSEKEQAHRVIDQIQSVHVSVEDARKAKIPDWAYRDVLYMLIHYSVASFELLVRKLTFPEKEEVFDVFYRLGTRMGLKDMPTNYDRWVASREQHLIHDLAKSEYTIDLLMQYKKHLGLMRYTILIEAQKLVVPRRVNDLLGFGKVSFFRPLISLYKLSRLMKIDRFLVSSILPSEYKKQIMDLNNPL
jgi:uncharacterized protein (DUF2236 family)